MALVMAVQLPHCTATDNLWRRNWVDLSSPVAPLILLPSSLTKEANKQLLLYQKNITTFLKSGEEHSKGVVW